MRLLTRNAASPFRAAAAIIIAVLLLAGCGSTNDDYPEFRLTDPPADNG